MRFPHSNLSDFGFCHKLNELSKFFWRGYATTNPLRGAFALALAALQTAPSLACPQYGSVEKLWGQAYGAAKIPPIGRDMPSSCNGCNKLKHNNLHITVGAQYFAPASQIPRPGAPHLTSVSIVSSKQETSNQARSATNLQFGVSHAVCRRRRRWGEMRRAPETGGMPGTLGTVPLMALHAEGMSTGGWNFSPALLWCPH